MEINIYLESSIRGPGKGRGWYGYVVEACTGEKVKKKTEDYGYLEGTANQIYLTALIEALKRFTRPSIITLYANNHYLINGFTQGWLAQWKKSGWTNLSGKEIKNKELWKQVPSGHAVRAIYTKQHKYSKTMKERNQE